MVKKWFKMAAYTVFAITNRGFGKFARLQASGLITKTHIDFRTLFGLCKSESFHVKQAKVKQKCHHGSGITKLVFIMDSASIYEKVSYNVFL
jgi:hypothetical protein